MYLDFTILDDVLLSSFNLSTKNELEKAKDIKAQLKNSIEWLSFEASKENRYQEKSNLLKEITAANMELDRISKEINKAN